MAAFRCLRQNLCNKLFQSRTYTLMILHAGIMYLYMKPVLKFSETADYGVSLWVFPFIISNIYFLFLFMFGVVYYFSDVPFMQYEKMYQVIRVGRRCWAFGQIGTIMIQSFLIMLYNYILTVVMLAGKWDFTADWGKLLHTVALTNAGEYYGFLFGIPYQAMESYTGPALTVLTLVIGSLVISFLGLVMFAVSLVVNRIAAVSAAGVMVVMIYVVENMPSALMQRTACFAPVVWMRAAYLSVKEHDSYILPPAAYIFSVLIIGILILCGIIMLKANRIEFLWTKEE